METPGEVWGTNVDNSGMPTLLLREGDNPSTVHRESTFARGKIIPITYCGGMGYRLRYSIYPDTPIPYNHVFYSGKVTLL
jgi:hypothetical protein